MGDIAKNFSRVEFACKGESCCGHSAPISLLLVTSLQRLRDMASEYLARDCPIRINSGFRCNVHNARVASEDTTKPHTLGIAADCACEFLTPYELATLAMQIEEFENGGIGIYQTFTHLDVRGYKARWKNV